MIFGSNNYSVNMLFVRPIGIWTSHWPFSGHLMGLCVSSADRRCEGWGQHAFDEQRRMEVWRWCWIWGGHFIQVILILGNVKLIGTSTESVPSVNMHSMNTRKSGDGREWRIIKTSCFIWRRMNSWSCVPRAVMQTHLSFISVTLLHSTPCPFQSIRSHSDDFTPGLCVAGKEILLLHFLLRQEHD